MQTKLDKGILKDWERAVISLWMDDEKQVGDLKNTIVNHKGEDCLVLYETANGWKLRQLKTGKEIIIDYLTGITLRNANRRLY